MNIALIVGCARSGTSILGELIEAHPEIQYVFEAHSVWELGGSGINNSHRMVAQDATEFIKARVRNWFEERNGGACLIVEKNPRNTLRIPYVREIFPEAKIIHIVRDGRDVACSLVPGCGGAEWWHLKPPSWQVLMSNYEGPMRCARAWKEIMEIALADLSGVCHLQLRYEDLVNDPFEVATRIMTYLGLGSHPAVEDFCLKIQNSTDCTYHARQQSMWYRSDHRSRIDRWRENLSREEQSVIRDLLAPLLHELDYEV